MTEASIATLPDRPGLSRLLLGTMLFLASEMLFFGGLFAAYFTLRAQTSPWPPRAVDLDVGLSAIGTTVLLVSSATLQLGVKAAEAGSIIGLRRWTVATLGLGIAFLGLQALDYSQLSFGIESHAYGTLYVAMTSLHGLHVVAGVVLMMLVLVRATLGAFREGDLDGLHATAYYWHFVDVVWVALFSTLFILR